MSRVTERQAEQLRDIFDGRTGKENAITSGEIRDRLDIDENETTPQTRAIITYLLKEEELPIVARTSGQYRGYFIAETEDEVYNYLGTLSSRANQIEDRHRAVQEAAQASEHLSLVPDEIDEEFV